MKKTTLIVSSLLMLAGCQHMPGSSSFVSSSANGWQSADFSQERLKEGAKLPFKLANYIPEDKVNSSTRALVAEAAVYLDKGDFEKASALLNTALKLDLGNSYLHFMNALTYHLMAKAGNTKNYEFAEQGYQLAYKFDQTNMLAKYYLGLAYFDQRKFKDAQAEFAAAAVMDEGDAEILYDLARASYFANDPRTSKAALDKVKTINAVTASQGKFIRANILTNAALDRDVEAKSLLAQADYDEDTRRFLADRIAAWQRFHQQTQSGSFQQAGYQLAQVLPESSGLQRIPGAAPSTSSTAESMTEDDDFINDEMVVVDVVIIRTQEDVSTNRGLNLLSGLELQFGNPLTNVSGLSYSRSKTNDRSSNNADTDSQTISQLISVPAVKYSLNIFNSLDSRNEILASPSLVALANEKSEFFSGVDVVAAAVSGGDGSSISVNKQIGVKLGVTPEFLANDRIKLQVEAERTFLTSPSSSVQFEFRLDTSNTNVNANVVMKFGETLILSGLSEKETENNRDAVPLLGDIPVVQYLFSNQQKREFRKSVLIMITPRRAQYVNQSDEERAKTEAALSDFERSLTTFEQRNQNWFTPPSTTSEIIKVTEVNSLMNEFKTGDFELENWNSRDTHEKRLSKAVDFLFY